MFKNLKWIHKLILITENIRYVNFKVIKWNITHDMMDHDHIPMISSSTVYNSEWLIAQSAIIWISLTSDMNVCKFHLIKEIERNM